MYNVQANLTIKVGSFEIDNSFIMVTLILGLHKYLKENFELL